MRLGIIGGGQLGRMLADAALRLGVTCSFWIDGEQEHTMTHWKEVYSGGDQAFSEFCKNVDVLTYEYEHLPLHLLDNQPHVSPSQQALAVMQDRLFEKELFERLDIRSARYVEVSQHEDLLFAAEKLGFPFILKTRRAGYDGKGQYRFQDAVQLSQFVLPDVKGGFLAEGWVSFQTEVSLIAVRSRNGQTAFYPLTENKHEHGILIYSRPVPHHGLFQSACHHAERILNDLNYAGVFTIEYFVDENGLIANEMAPRVHNSGHWTIEGALTSQFENHVRAILGWPLGGTTCIVPVMMFNVLSEWPDASTLCALERARVHCYGKTNRKGRKLGHITTFLQSFDRAHAEAEVMVYKRIKIVI